MITFLDLHKINNRFQDKFEAAFKSSLETSQFVLGANVSKFENDFADYCGTKYCLGTANGLDSLTLILRGYIQIGRLKKGDKIIVPANTFIATILSILHADLEPVFVEPHPDTYNLSIENTIKAYSRDVKAVIVVHLYGGLADVEQIQSFCEENSLILIEDAAQAHGAMTTVSAKRAGNLGNAGAFSFYPSKNLGALGDGGAVTTNDSKLFEAISLLRNYGSIEKYKNDVIGFNSRLDDLQASFLSIKLGFLERDNERRRSIATQYLSGIQNSKLKLPRYNGSTNHVFYAFVIEVEDRSDFTNYLDNNKVGWLIHYPIPPHQQKALHQYSHLKLPITEQIHKRIISLPISPVMTNEDVKKVIEVVNAY